MALKDRPSVLRETDDQAKTEARALLRGARFCALAVIDPETGFPSATRVLTATAPDGAPVILISALSAHTRALDADPRCSLLAGEPGKGDPLAHPRLSLQARARRVGRDEALHAWLRGRFLRRHPKAALYIDFDDFRFVRLEPVRANLNGGFGKAYVIEGEDLLIRHPDTERLASSEHQVLAEITTLDENLASEVARNKFRMSGNSWEITALDMGGIDISSKDILLRVEIPFKDMNMAHMVSDIRKVACSIP